MCIYAHLAAAEQQKVHGCTTTHAEELFLTGKDLLIPLCGLGNIC